MVLVRTPPGGHYPLMVNLSKSSSPGRLNPSGSPSFDKSKSGLFASFSMEADDAIPYSASRLNRLHEVCFKIWLFGVLPESLSQLKYVSVWFARVVFLFLCTHLLRVSTTLLRICRGKKCHC